MTKLEALEKKYQQAQKKAAAEHEIIAKKEQELADIMKAETAAATKGDVEGYASAKAKREALQDEVYVLKTSDPISSLIHPDDVTAAWNECCTGYEKTVSALIAEVEEKTKALQAVYRKMEAAQVQLLQQRDKVAEMGRIKPDADDYSDQYRNTLPVAFVGLKGRLTNRLSRSPHVLVEYLAESGQLNNDDVSWSNMIFNAHRLF